MSSETRAAEGVDKGASAELSPELEYLMPPKWTLAMTLAGDCDPNREMKLRMTNQESVLVNSYLNWVRGLRVLAIVTLGAWKCLCLFLVIKIN